MFVNFLPLNCVVGSSCGPGTCGGTAAGSRGGLASCQGKSSQKEGISQFSWWNLQFCVRISDLYTNTTFNHLFECSEKTQQSLPHGGCQTESWRLVSNMWASWQQWCSKQIQSSLFAKSAIAPDSDTCRGHFRTVWDICELALDSNHNSTLSSDVIWERGTYIIEHKMVNSEYFHSATLKHDCHVCFVPHMSLVAVELFG